MSGARELPPVTVARKAGQRTLRLRVTADGIVCSAPARIPEAEVIRFINEHGDWIRKKWSEVSARMDVLAQTLETHKGSVFIGGVWKPVVTVRSAVRSVQLSEMPERVLVRHNQTRVTGALLTRALREKAEADLPAHVKRLSAATGIPCGAVSVRNQKTRWGSCASSGDINLNWRLIKCIPAVRDYVIIHELAHIKVFNHSPAFWELVHRIMPEYRTALAWIAQNGSLVFAPELDIESGK